MGGPEQQVQDLPNTQEQAKDTQEQQERQKEQNDAEQLLASLDF